MTSRAALDRGELELRYRTVASMLTGDVNSVEAGVRWNHATRGWLEPDEFIPIASTTGMIEQIDRWVLATAARDVASWRADHPGLVAWITVSGRLFVHGDEASHILSILDASGADHHSVGIEIGEDNVVRNFDEIASVRARPAGGRRLRRARQLLRAAHRFAAADATTRRGEARPRVPRASSAPTSSPRRRSAAWPA